MPSAKLKQARRIGAGPINPNERLRALCLSRLWRTAKRLGRTPQGVFGKEQMQGVVGTGESRGPGRLVNAASGGRCRYRCHTFAIRKADACHTADFAGLARLTLRSQGLVQSTPPHPCGSPLRSKPSHRTVLTPRRKANCPASDHASGATLSAAGPACRHWPDRPAAPVRGTARTAARSRLSPARQ